jgi:protein-disulfide isomerase
MKAGWVMLAALAGTAACAAPAAAAATAKAHDWTRTVAATPEGGFRMGNPAAQVKLVEYGSLTCPHCAHFAAEAMPALRSEVRSGKVSYEYRNFVLNGIDVAASLLARCGGPKGFFAIADALYSTQPKWMSAYSDMPSEQQDALNALPKGQRLAKIADIGGLYQISAKGGVSAVEGRQCLADPAGLDRLSSLHNAASALGVTGTPAFFVDGKRVDGATWEAVDAQIRTALGSGG